MGTSSPSIPAWVSRVIRDIRDIRAKLVDAGLEPTTDLDSDDTGPAHVTLEGPDGNWILVDQFFDRPDRSHPES